MALVADLEKTAVSADGTLTTWTDNTVYGGANPDRNAVAVYFTVYKVDEDLEETAVTVQSFDPETASTFVSTNGVDGRYKAYFIIVDYYAGGTTYERYDLAYDAAGNTFYEYINSTPAAGIDVSNAAYWSAIADPTSVIQNVGTASESGNVVYQVVETILYYATSKCYSVATIEDAKNSCGNGDCDDCGCGDLQKIDSLLQGMRIADAYQLYTEGERLARQAEKFCADCGCA